ncbi:hypothetical protein B0H13DRAFT_1902708 [Mycena leptocephala]|nr:hypothetical protein B0H13DRAFT_1902708 [Mycena leptocephala]
MPPVRSSGRKHRLKLAGNDLKQRTEIGHKREKRRDEARRKDSAHSSAASRAGEYIALKAQISICTRASARASHSMAISELRAPLESRKQCPAVLDPAPRKRSCSSCYRPVRVHRSSSTWKYVHI